MRKAGDDIHIGPSEFYWGKSPEKIHTVLGSCISITIWNSLRKTGGMCHFLLPGKSSDEKPSEGVKYCEDSKLEFERYILKEGSPRSVYEVKLFGGAAMFAPGFSSVGEMNIQCAENFLSAAGFVIKGRHVGGSSSRHIIFELESGDVWVRTNSGALVPEEKIDAIDENLDDDSESFYDLEGIHE